MQLGFKILYEDNHILVINKPAEMPTMGDPSRATVHSRVAEYWKHKYKKPGNVYVGIVSRLDSMTSGTLVVARTSKAASRLQPQFADKAGGATKIYLALMDGDSGDECGAWSDELIKDDHSHRMRVARRDQTGTKGAELDWLRLSGSSEISLIALRLRTGRKHQIRVQASSRGWPILGDRKYGSKRPFPAGIALHSLALQIIHPTKQDSRWFLSPPPGSWAKSLRSIHCPPVESIVEMVQRHWNLNGEIKGTLSS